MEDASIVVAFCGSIVFWVVAVIGILVTGLTWEWARSFSRTLVGQWRPTLGIAVVYVASGVLGGQGGVILSGIEVFCQALVGLALARGIVGYEPLPVARSFARREHVWRSVGKMVGASLVLVPLILVISAVGASIGRLISGGASLSYDSVAGMFPAESWRIFFPMLSGAGIAEKTPYRLVMLSLLWRLTRRRWVAIVLSAVVFGAYHLTPVNSMYATHWQAPISQFFVTTLAGLVMGYVYAKQGYETAVLGHAFGNWIPCVLFAAG